MPSIRTLHVFVAAARLGSFAAAGKEMGLTAAAVGLQMKALEEDPSLSIVHDPDTGETLMEGQGEMHLRVALERLTVAA